MFVWLPFEFGVVDRDCGGGYPFGSDGRSLVVTVVRSERSVVRSSADDRPFKR